MCAQGVTEKNNSAESIVSTPKLFHYSNVNIALFIQLYEVIKIFSYAYSFYIWKMD